jgi:transcription elongation regulator 1
MDPSQSSQPLPRGWTEHVGPQGQVYYHDKANGKSTYYRPRFAAQSSSGPRLKQKIVKKERIPNTDGWIRVTTNRGNVFYAHPLSRRSEWQPPDEIHSQLESMLQETEHMQQQHRAEQERRRIADEKRAAEARHVQAQEAKKKKEQERMVRQAEAQRKHEERVTLLHQERKRTENEEGGRESSKRTKESHEIEDDEAEKAWQRSMAAEMAAEAEGAKDDRGEVSSQLDKVTLSSEESRQIFMHMLTSFNGTANEINPMMPWDRELRKFVDHRDYDVLPSLRDREDVFNEWCKLRIREKRALRIAKSSVVADVEGSDLNASRKTGSTTDAYRTLLEREVVSTRTKWEDFRKMWKKDPDFYRFGRDDREREKAFRDWLVELGEKKRKAAELADSAFTDLLKEKLDRDDLWTFSNGSDDEQHAMWASTKTNLDRDPRYEAVGSSSRRFELFKGWVIGSRSHANNESGSTTKQHRQSDKHANDRNPGDAIKRREEEVRRQRKRAETEKLRTSGHAVKEDSRLAFQQLLLDSIHDPLASLPYAFDAIVRDPRFSSAVLSDDEKEELFFDHMDRLNERRLKALEHVFAKHAPTLDIVEEEALPLILDDDEVSRRSLTKIRSIVNGRKQLRDLFVDWKEERIEEARQAFRQMLKENAFVDFWGRLRQEYESRMASSDQSHAKPAGNADGEEGADDTPDLLQMASHIDLDEIHAVLERDPRYRAFDHAPEKRSQWIREYLQTMQIPKKTVFQQ